MTVLAADVPQEHALRVIGDAEHLRHVLDAWQHIELDEPLERRRDTLRSCIHSGDPFWNIHVALAFLAARWKPRSYLEIGVRSGGSLVVVLANADLDSVTGVDLWAGEYAEMPNTLAFARQQIEGCMRATGKAPVLDLIQRSSHDALPELRARGATYDLITVDGDHSEEGAWADLVGVLPLLGDRGVIVFDDIIHVSHRFLLDVALRLRREHPELRLVLNTTQDNGCALFLKGLEPAELLST